MKHSGIYCIENTLNGKKYVGSSINMHKRRLSHFRALRTKKHRNRKLQYSFNKYGESSFNFYILENVLFIEDLICCEQKWIDKIKPDFNIMPYADRREFSRETKQRLSESHKGHKHTEEAKKKIGQASKGNKHRIGAKISEEQKNAIRNAKIGKRGRKGEDNPLYGRKRPKEVIDRCVETRRLNKEKRQDCFCGNPFYAKQMCKYHYKEFNRKKNENINKSNI